MTRNMSRIDRAIRGFVVAPIAIVAAVLLGAGSIAGIVLFAIAAIMIVTAAVGVCPLYSLLHLDTRGGRPATQ
jgi:DUF2892 family protein